MESTASLERAVSEYFPTDLVFIGNDTQHQGSKFEFYITDVTTMNEQSGSSSRQATNDFTVAWFKPAEYYFPQFTMQPKSIAVAALKNIAGISSIDFPAYPDFSEKYDLTATSRTTTTKLFTDSLIQSVTGNSNYYVQSANGSLLLALKGYSRGGGASPGIGLSQYRLMDGPERDVFMEDARNMFEAFYSAAEKTNMTEGNVMNVGADLEAEIANASGFMKRILKKAITRQHLQLFLATPPPRPFDYQVKCFFKKQASLDAIIGCFVVAAIIPATFAAFIEYQKSLGIKIDLLSGWGITTVLLTMITLGAAVFQIRHRRRKRRLFSEGAVTSSTILDVVDTRAAINGAKIFRVDYSYQVDGIEYKDSVKLHGESVKRAKVRKKRNENPDILVDPKDPGHSLYADAMVSTSVEVEI